MQIVAFGHKSRVGKDTSAKLLETELRARTKKLKFKKISFAARLKEVTYLMYAWAGVQPAAYYEDNPDARSEIIPALGMTVVDLWIRVGNDARRIHKDTWVRSSFEVGDVDVAIVTDMRFWNEAETVEEKNGLLVRVERESAPVRDSESDRDLDNFTRWTHTLKNNGSMKELNTLICESIVPVVLARLGQEG